jgi:hypothetical protein
MHLLGREPANATHVWVQFRETLSDGVRKFDANEEPFGTHLLALGRARLCRAEVTYGGTRCGSTESRPTS